METPVRKIVFRYLAVLVLSGAAVLGHVSSTHAQQGAPFGASCDSVEFNGNPYVPGANCRYMAVDGYIRRFIVWVPLGGVPAGSPAVIMLHGASGDGGLFLGISGWREKATQENFVAIFPTAVEHFVLETQRFSTRWNNYDLPTEIDPNRRPNGYPATSPWPADDVKFVRRISADVVQQLSVDPHRLYVAGFSSGGGMCARLGVEASDLIAAVACHTSGLHQLHETLVGARNLSAFFTLGTRDGNALEVVNDYLIARGLPPIAELPLDPADLDRIPQIKTQVLLNLDSFNLQAAPLTTVTGPTTTQIHGQTTQPGNNDGNELFFTFLDDVTHQYPNGRNNFPLNFNVPDVVWPFFLQHPRP
jgi:poly(3-hydroxybutyrate) depolymerase